MVMVSCVRFHSVNGSGNTLRYSFSFESHSMRNLLRAIFPFPLWAIDEITGCYHIKSAVIGYALNFAVSYALDTFHGISFWRAMQAAFAAPDGLGGTIGRLACRCGSIWGHEHRHAI